MIQYILRRILINIPILIGVTMLVFAAMAAAPGDPLAAFISPEMARDPATLAHWRKEFGLDQPLPVRYVRWLGEVLQGNLGYRIKTFDPVGRVIMQRIPNTLLLMTPALVIGVSLGVLLGVFSALKKFTFWDNLLTALVFISVSTPAFLIGLAGLYVFSLQLRWFPAGGMRTLGQEESLLNLLHHLALPTLILSAGYLAMMLRYTRASVLDVISEPYVMTARAKGLVERLVIWRHIVRNALIPIVTVVGFSIPTLLAGAVFTETIFAWPGMGSLFVDAVNSRDFPLVMGITLVTSVAVLACNLITDIVYAIINPKIRYS